MSFSQYEDFKQDCVDRDISIDIKDEEYIDLINLRDDGAILVTILSRKDPLFNRQVWSYNATNITPELDFKTKVYFMDPLRRFEFSKEINSAQQLSFSTYESNSASYLLLNPMQNLDRESNDGLFLTVKDDDDILEVDFDITIKKEFFQTSIEKRIIKLKYDQEDAYLEYSKRPLRVVGDFIETKKLFVG
jgi:hypothetical protein